MLIVELRPVGSSAQSAGRQPAARLDIDFTRQNDGADRRARDD